MRQGTASPTTLSVVIPARDTWDLVAACLGSLERSRARAPREIRMEVLVVDDGGEDDLGSRVTQLFPGVRVLRHPVTRGYSAAVNTGVAGSRGDLLWLLNSDTEVDEDSLERLLVRFDEQPELGICGPTLEYPDGRPQWSGGVEPRGLWFFLQSSGLGASLARRRRRPRAVSGEVDWVTGAAWAMRRSVYEQHGPLNESYRFFCQDLELCGRAVDGGWKVEIATDIRVVHHHGATIGADGGPDVDRRSLLLWQDLVDWVTKRRGPRAANRARRSLILGARLRSAALRVRGLLRRAGGADALAASRQLRSAADRLSDDASR